ncbi:MAG: 4-hydroxybenzoate 3-monooxygenase [Deltaproteobacteria bacterium]|jgi:p-hydroxybenzoate 3-monooxygenase|nr:4-hydroxybenzoate 3-monooxygenase [Deltaproteobacteria bacterium]
MNAETQVGIIGAGPSGLLLSHLLHLEGIDSVVLEARSRKYVVERVRAGVLEQGTVDLLSDSGLGDRLRREGLVHHGIELRCDGRGHRIALSDLTGGRAIWIYGQQEIVKDLINARLEADATIHFEVDEVNLSGLDSTGPVIKYRKNDRDHKLRCDFIAGCDGFHGVSRDSIPAGVLRTYQHVYPFGWLGILAAVAPSTEELIYAYHDRGFALHSLRSPEISRLYVQVKPDEDIKNWPDDRIWEELSIRLATDDGWTLTAGPVLEKGITPMRSFVAEPMQYGRLFLAGDAAHIVPATGAKGLNLAVHDIRILAEAFTAWFRTGTNELLERYSATCLNRVWRVQDFSSFMSLMLHHYDDDDGFRGRLQRAQLEYVCSSEAAARSLAENYVGLPHV